MRNSRIHTVFGRLLSLTLSLVMVIGMMTLPGGAISTVQATINPDLNVVIDGQKRTFYNAQGQQVHPVVYNGTTYLPVRAIGELMGKNVDWNQNTLTATIGGPRQTAAVKGTPDVNPAKQTITAELRDDFTIIVDGSVRTFTDANGKTVYPLLYQGSNYLPLRAIGTLMGKTVAWNQTTQTATLSNGGGTVTDADTFGQGGTQSGNQGGILSLGQAKQKALAHAGLSASQVTFVEQKPDWDKGRQVYDIEFHTADYKEYDYEIDAITGAVLDYDYDAEFYNPPKTPGQGTTTGQGSTTTITADKAKQIALAKVSGATAANVVKCKLDRDDGIQVYEIEIRVGRMEYEFEINAVTGAILSMDIDD